MNKSYIFDLDGTLLDSSDVWLDIDIAFLGRRGIAVPPDYTDEIAAMSFPEIAVYTRKRFGLTDSVNSIMQEWNDMAIYAYENTVPLKIYAKEYLLRLHGAGAKLAIATSATPELYMPALHNHGIYDLFHTICNADDVGCGKSRPDIFLLTAKKLDTSPCDCIVFDDLLAAVKSAKSIGMTVYGMFDKASKADWDDIKAIADGVLCDFKDAPIF